MLISGISRPFKEASQVRGNCHALPRSPEFGRSNHTSFCAGLLGEHFAVDSWECEHLTVHIGANPGRVRCTPSLGILGVAVVVGRWKSNVTACPLDESVVGSSKTGHAWGTPGGSPAMCPTLCWTSVVWALMPLMSVPAV